MAETVTRDNHVYLAKLAEQAERYEGKYYISSSFSLSPSFYQATSIRFLDSMSGVSGLLLLLSLLSIASRKDCNTYAGSIHTQPPSCFSFYLSTGSSTCLPVIFFFTIHLPARFYALYLVCVA